MKSYAPGLEPEISLHQTVWNTKKPENAYIEFGEHIKEAIVEVRKYKTENQMSMKDMLPELILTCPKKFRDFYKKTEKDLKACTRAEKINFRS